VSAKECDTVARLNNCFIVFVIVMGISVVFNIAAIFAGLTLI